MQIRSFLRFSYRAYSILIFEYRAHKIKTKSKIIQGDLVRVKERINDSRIVLKLNCPNTGKIQNKIILPGTICVFIGTIHRINIDNFPRAVILHDGILSYISNHRQVENILEKVN